MPIRAFNMPFTFSSVPYLGVKSDRYNCGVVTDTKRYTLFDTFTTSRYLLISYHRHSATVIVNSRYLDCIILKYKYSEYLPLMVVSMVILYAT